MREHGLQVERLPNRTRVDVAERQSDSHVLTRRTELFLIATLSPMAIIPSSNPEFSAIAIGPQIGTPKSSVPHRDESSSNTAATDRPFVRSVLITTFACPPAPITTTSPFASSIFMESAPFSATRAVLSDSATDLVNVRGAVHSEAGERPPKTIVKSGNYNRVAGQIPACHRPQKTYLVKIKSLYPPKRRTVISILTE